MQKGGILNSHIAKVLADLGHTDTICIGDCGLPVPAGVQKIDLALTFGIHIASPMEEMNPHNYAVLQELYPQDRYEWVRTDHEAFKEATKQCKCIIRTGETTPYANVILQADCIFNDEK